MPHPNLEWSMALAEVIQEGLDLSMDPAVMARLLREWACELERPSPTSCSRSPFAVTEHGSFVEIVDPDHGKGIAVPLEQLPALIAALQAARERRTNMFAALTPDALTNNRAVIPALGSVEEGEGLTNFFDDPGEARRNLAALITPSDLDAEFAAAGGEAALGLEHVLAIFRSPRVARLWLLTPHPRLGQRPLDRLNAGDVDAVLAAADDDYGQQI